MTDVIAAREAYEKAQRDAQDLIRRARLALGKAISDAREQGVPQEAIARQLGLTREQLRRVQREYEATRSARS